MLRLRHLLHPLRSADALRDKVTRDFWRYRVELRLRDLRREERDQCWCGGQLFPFPWHASYGVCPDCGCYVNRRPPRREELPRIYSSTCYWGAFSRMRGMPTLPERAAVYRADGRLEHWLHLVQRYGSARGRVIEIGCAPGVLLVELTRRGYECVGVEAEERVVAWIRREMGLDVRTGLFPDPGLRLEPCDLFLAFDVLEHVHSPEEFLRAAAGLLRPGGTLIIQAPIDRYNDPQPFGQELSVVFDDVEHLYIFVDRAMRELGARAGLDVLSLDEPPWLKRHELCIYRKPGGGR